MPLRYPYTTYFWLVPSPTGKVRKTRYRLSEFEAAQYPGAVRIDADSLVVTAPTLGEEHRGVNAASAAASD